MRSRNENTEHGYSQTLTRHRSGTSDSSLLAKFQHIHRSLGFGIGALGDDVSCVRGRVVHREVVTLPCWRLYSYFGPSRIRVGNFRERTRKRERDRTRGSNDSWRARNQERMAVLSEKQELPEARRNWRDVGLVLVTSAAPFAVPGGNPHRRVRSRLRARACSRGYGFLGRANRE